MSERELRREGEEGGREGASEREGGREEREGEVKEGGSSDLSFKASRYVTSLH